MKMCCPGCTSENVYYSKKKRIWICEECELEFEKNVSSESISSGADYTIAEYWTPQLWDVAPVALALSYHQLYEYVAAKNIGCTLFLIRDVFELMIKIPVTIIFNGIHELNKDNDSFSHLLDTDTKAAKLYEYSMQMLSTGKWWECVRLACSLDGNIFTGNSTDAHTELYADTIRYLNQLHKLLYFKVPGSQKISMVTWRNRTLGHSCLADNPEEKYNEIPYILEMFRIAGEVGVEYYRKVCLTDSNKNPLCGIALNRTEAEVYIQYIPQECGQATYSEIHNFIAGRDNNLSCFDGFEKGKAYLLNYSNGERYTHQHLSEWLTNRRKTLDEVTAGAMLSDEDVFADNLETKDINTLEEQLSVSDDIISVSFLGRWLMDAVNSCDKGMLLLTAERGLGKSTFCSTLDPFEVLEIKYYDEAYAEELEEFLGDVAVRVWHFNSEYRSRSDIFIPGIRDSLLTIDIESGNRICGRLESQYNNLLSCAEDLRSLYFTECLNNTMGEYRVRTDKQKLLLIFDGIDEVADIGELCSFMPDPSRLDEDVYILLTCRTKQEISQNKQLAEFIEATQSESHLDFTRDNFTVTKTTETEIRNENTEYRDVVSRYVQAIVREQGRTVTNENVTELLQSFEYRFASLAAYRKLCRLSRAFNDKAGTDLFGVFIHQVESNAPETYVKRLKWLLNTLVWVGEPVTLRELAFLSGERYVSYRLLGMMNDIQAFIKVTRSSRGNCYELSHSQWEDAVKALVPYGDIYFRKQCNELIAEMESFFNESNIELIIEKIYEGELWLLRHILDIYNRNWKAIKENWFEEIRIGSFEYLIQLLLNSDVIKYEKFDTRSINALYRLGSTYISALKTFDQLPLIKEDVFLSNPVLSSVSDICNNVLICVDDLAVKIQCFEIQADLFHLKATNTNNGYFTTYYLEQSLQVYEGELCLIDKNDTEFYSTCLYKQGRANHLLKNYSVAKEILIEFINIASVSDVSYSVRQKLCIAYIRLGQILSRDLGESEKVLTYYLKAYELSKKLVTECESATYLDTLSYAESILSEYFEEIGCMDEAIDFREKSLISINHVIKLNPHRKYENYKYHSLCSLGKLYQQTEKYVDSKKIFEEALMLERDGFNACTEEILKSLAEICTILEDASATERYTARVLEEEEFKQKYANAYQEVLEIIRYLPKSEYNKIPREKIEYYSLHQNVDHGFRFDVTRPLNEQNIMLETNALIVTLYKNFFGTSLQNEKIDKILRRNSIAKEINTIEEIVEKIKNVKKVSAVQSETDYTITDDINGETYTVLYYVLSKIPKIISLQIPNEVLLHIKENRILSIYNSLSDCKTEYLSDEVVIELNRLFEIYIPNIEQQISQYRASLPDFDLDFLDS